MLLLRGGQGCNRIGHVLGSGRLRLSWGRIWDRWRCVLWCYRNSVRLPIAVRRPRVLKHVRDHLVVTALGVCLARVVLGVGVMVCKDVVAIVRLLMLDTLNLLCGFALSA